MSSHVKFLPDEKDQDATRLLPWLMAVMVYLSALALMGNFATRNIAGDWAKDLTSRLSVQITEKDADKKQAIADEVEQVLRKTPGIAGVTRLSDQELDNLLAPWLGAGNISDDLPIPIMIDVTLADQAPVNIRALESKLRKISPSVFLDDHKKWLKNFMELVNSVEYLALGILVLVVLASVGIVIFGTKAGLAEHRDTIQIMHMMGARDSMIAGAYQRRFMKHGLKGGLVGLFVALISIYAVLKLLQDLTSGTVSMPDTPWIGLAILCTLPICAAVISMITARFTVLRELAKIM